MGRLAAVRRLGDREAIDRLVAETVPDPADRFDLEALDRPLAGGRFESAEDSTATWPGTSPTTWPAAPTRPTAPTSVPLMAMLLSFGTLGRIGASRTPDARSRVEGLGRWWFSFFMYYASGPPPARLRQFLALAQAGLPRFIGADTVVTADIDRAYFVAPVAAIPRRSA